MSETPSDSTANSKCQQTTGEPSTGPTIQEIAQRYLKNLEWTQGVVGRCQCPGAHKHTTKSHSNDCWIFINGVPTVTCLHQSCKDEVAAANAKIREAWSLFQPPVDESIVAAAKERAAKRYALEAKAKASLPEILKQYKWDVDEIAGKNLYLGTCATRAFLQGLYRPADLLWIGEPETTGRPEHSRHWATREEWCAVDAWPHYTCASTFKPGTYSRSNINAASTPYLIVEGDKVLGKEPENEKEKLENKNACGAIFNWLRHGPKLVLRAVIDSGNKSLHAWYDMPALATYEELKTVLPALGCDRAMFKPTQPARLPGVIRDNGKEQKLLWIR